MGAKDLSPNLSTALDAAVGDVITSMLNTASAPVPEDKIGAIDGASSDVIACIPLTGDTNGAVCLAASGAATSKMGEQIMPGMGPDEEDEVLKELTNMIAGPLDKIFADGGVKITRGVPEIVRGGTPSAPACAAPAFLVRAYALTALSQFFVMRVHEA